MNLFHRGLIYLYIFFLARISGHITRQNEINRILLSKKTQRAILEKIALVEKFIGPILV